MGKGGDVRRILADHDKDYTAEEVAKHANYATKGNSWIVFCGQVYDISNFASKHPGGWELITTYEGHARFQSIDS
jgi:cytochrome b involved in lipid metabolism